MKKILVTEDNDSNYLLMTHILKGHYEFERARHGQEAVEMVEKGSYDMVLMDLRMPIMDGLQASRLIKEKHPDLPIIALTANAFADDRKHALEAGCNEFLAKPVSHDTCLEVIARFI